MKEKRCLQCGKCCKHLILQQLVTDKDEIYFYKQRGFKVKGQTVIFDIPHTCPQLTEDNKCKLSWEDKPKVCKRYPSGLQKEDMEEGCGYK